MLFQARAATDALFGLFRPGAFHDRPVPERHRTIFYFAHLEAFDWNLLTKQQGVRHSIRNRSGTRAVTTTRAWPISVGWDNEFHGHEVSISAFGMSQYKVTNGEYLEFVHAGALFEAITPDRGERKD